MNRENIESRLCTACDASGAACCKSGSVFLSAGELEGLERHCTADRDAAFQAEFHRRVAEHDGFAMLDQGDGCLFLDADNRCTLHALSLKPQECYWWPLHVYIEPEDNNEQMSICVADYCCNGLPSMEDARAFAAQYVPAMAARLPELRRFRRIFPGSAPRKLVARITAGGMKKGR